MSSIFRPLNVQLPAQALSQSASALTAYEQLQDIRAKRQEADRQRHRKAIIEQLTGRAMSGDQNAIAELTQQFPQAFMKYQEDMLGLKQKQYETTQEGFKTREAEHKAEDTDRARERRRLGIIKQAASTIEGDPLRYQDIVKALEANGVLPQGLLPNTIPTAAEFGEFKKDLALSEMMLDDHEIAKDLGEEEAIMRQVHGYGTPQYKAELANLWGLRKRALEADIQQKLRPRSPGVAVYTGEVTKGTRQKLETAQADEKILLHRIQQVAELEPWFDELTTWWGRAKTSLAEIVTQSGLVDANSSIGRRVQAAQHLYGRIQGVFLPMRKFFTGVAGPMAEMEELRNSFISIRMGPSQLRAAIQHVYDMADDSLAIREQILSEGINPQKNRRLYNERASELWKAYRPVPIRQLLISDMERLEPWNASLGLGSTAADQLRGLPYQGEIEQRDVQQPKQRAPVQQPTNIQGAPDVPQIGPIPQDSQQAQQQQLPLQIAPQQAAPTPTPEPGATEEGRRRLREEAERQAQEEIQKRRDRLQGKVRIGPPKGPPKTPSEPTKRQAPTPDNPGAGLLKDTNALLNRLKKRKEKEKKEQKPKPPPKKESPSRRGGDTGKNSR